MSEEPFRPTDCVYYLISRASLVTTAALKRDLAASGAGSVRPAYLGVLMSLWRDDDVRTVELARRAGLEPSSMTGLLDRMERDGLLFRAPDPDDRRAQRIRLTTAGREAERTVSEVVTRVLDRMLAGISDEELAMASDTLRRILRNSDNEAAR